MIFTGMCNLNVLFLGDEYGNNGIIILGSEERLERMTRSDDWFADGMFGMVPECIGQLYSIHCVMKGAIIPSIYALLPNKMQKTYERLLNILKELQVSYRAFNIFFYVFINKQLMKALFLQSTAAFKYILALIICNIRCSEKLPFKIRSCLFIMFQKWK